VADRSVSVPMTLSDLERQDARVKIFRRISLITTIIQNDHMRQDNARGEEHISRGQHRLYRKGPGPSAPQFWGSLLFMHTPFDAELPDLAW